MANVASRLCFCGCGRVFEACHGLPRSVRRVRKRELDALAQTHDVSVLFPCVRPQDPVLEAYAENMASALDPAEPRVPVDAVEEGILLLAEAERRRIVDDWVSTYPDRWESVCAAVGDSSLVARTFVASAVRGAISERRPVPREIVAVFEGGKLQRSPVAALGSSCSCHRWYGTATLRRCFGSRSAAAGGCRRSGSTMRSPWHSVTSADEQVECVRAVSARLGYQLPIAGLPTASQTLRHGCKIVATDDAAASELAALLLVMYEQALPKGGRLSLGRILSRPQGRVVQNALHSRQWRPRRRLFRSASVPRGCVP